LLLGFPFFQATAQHADKYNLSVFTGSHVLQPAIPQTTSRMAQPGLPAALKGWMGNRDRISGKYRDLYGPALAIPGNDMNSRVQYCLDQVLPALGLDKSEWREVYAGTAAHAGHAHFSQYISGRQVAFSRLSLRFTADGRLSRIRNRSYGVPEAGLSPVQTAAEALKSAVGDIPGITVSSQHTGDWEWFPVPSEAGYTLRPSWPFSIEGKAEGGMDIYLTGYVDAISGAVLYRSNEVKESLDLTVKGEVYKHNPLQPSSIEPLANLKIVIGGSTRYTDTAGVMDAGALNPPEAATISLEGKWAVVRADLAGSSVPTYTHQVNANGTIYTFPATAPSGINHVNAYYHVNRVHDYMRGYLTNFTSLDIPIETNVDVTGSCNAFYNGGSNSMNFYVAGNGCNSFALCGDIVYHEYGHAIASNFYRWQSGNSMRNGALNEGYADIWALGITGEAILGAGAYSNSGAYIRRYDQTPKVYPQDIRGEVHADGEIIAGAWWDLATNLGSVDSMMSLFAKAYYETPDGPNGTEGEVFHDALIGALLNDDDDQDLSNGTPNFTAIISAFARHGIYLLADARVAHNELTNQLEATPIPVTASVILQPDNMPLFSDIKLFYRKRGSIAWDSASMTPAAAGSFDFTGEIPGQAAGSIIDYYFKLYDYSGEPNVFAPAGYNPKIQASQSTIPYQFGVGIATLQKIDFESDLPGWQIGNNPGDNATSGIWIKAVPIRSSLNSVAGRLICQTGEDHTSGSGQCLVTGNAVNEVASINSADVDMGTTTVVTPAFDLSGYTHPVIEYYRWYSNDRGTNARTDAWQVQIKDAASNLWIHYVESTYQADYSWRKRIFSVNEYLPSAKSVQLRFIASDRVISNLPDNGQGTVEAAVDDFRIYDLGIETGVAGVAREEIIHIYPNPADKQVLITLPEGGTDGTITLYDLTGRTMLQVQTTGGQNQYQVATGQLPPGQYMLIVQTGRQIQARKLSILH